jgi:predicted transcriptional regulator/ADP-ribose pyrophosphatase YjhB (NUDIX family)
MSKQPASILKNFSKQKKLRFAELVNNIPSNKGAYYIKKLINQGFIVKNKDFYEITTKGENFLSYLDKLEEPTEIKQPIHDVFLIAMKGNKILIQKRKKRPFLGIIAPIGSRIRNGESIFKTANTKFFRDTGLSGEFELKGLIDSITIKGGKIFLHHILNVFKITNTKGILKNTEKGDNFWITEKEFYKQKNKMTGMKEHFDIVKSKGFTFLEIIQYIDKNGKFLKMKVIRKIRY